MKKLTPWFPTDVKPVRIGVYESKYHLFHKQWSIGFAYWNGKKWANSGDTVQSAYKNKDWIEGAIQEKQWRGLTEESK